RRLGAKRDKVMAVATPANPAPPARLRKGHEEGFALQLRLLELACRIGVGPHADAGVQPCAVLPEEAAPQRHGELAIASTVDPPDRARVPTPLQSLELVDEGVRRRARPAADRRSG